MADENGEVRRIKVYPLLTHALKKYTDMNLGMLPFTGRQMERKLLALQRLKSTLEANQGDLHGYRIEITCRGSFERMHQALDFFCSPRGLAAYVRLLAARV